jgi:uncharacterized protein YceK
MTEATRSTIKRFVWSAFVSVLCLGSLGCLSIYARMYPDSHAKTYPGVRFDAEIISVAATERPGLGLWLPVSLLDLPFSAAFDTVFLLPDWRAERRYRANGFDWFWNPNSWHRERLTLEERRELRAADLRKKSKANQPLQTVETTNAPQPHR